MIPAITTRIAAMSQQSMDALAEGTISQAKYDTIVAILARATRWNNGDSDIKADREEYMAESYASVAAPCDCHDNSEACSCPTGKVCLRKAMHMELEGIDADDAEQHGVNVMTGFRNSAFDDHMIIRECSGIIRAVAQLLTPMEDDE